MSKRWRPKSWKNPYPDKIDGDYYDCLNHRIFEAGADAMLESLFELARESPIGTFTIDSRIIHIYGGSRR